jgi:hypothetical protein
MDVGGYECDFQDREGVLRRAYQIPWGDVTEIIGHQHRGTAEDDAALVAALLKAGAPEWVRTASGWTDACGWGLIGPAFTERGTIAEARRRIAEFIRGFISEQTAFDAGDTFASAKEVRDYFNVQELEDVFGEPCPLTQEVLDAMADAVIEHRWHMEVPSMRIEDQEARFEAVRYAGEGGGEVYPDDPRRSDGAVIAAGTLEECRQEILAEARRLGLQAERWRPLDGMDDAVEAYHDSPDEGCGGWLIRRIAGG